jgi:hypothetical protein
VARRRIIGVLFALYFAALACLGFVWSGYALRNQGLLAAAQQGDEPRLLSLIERGADLNTRDRKGCTALMLAVFSNQAGSARVLLEHGADVNARTPDGWTALMFAAARGRLEIMQLLLAHGADANARSKNGATALQYAGHKIGGSEKGFTNLLRKAGARE